MYSAYRQTAEDLRREIEAFLFGLGFLCRVFRRGKDDRSLAQKIEKEPGKYTPQGKLVQDVVGIRVVLYFHEDIEIVKKILCARYTFDENSSTIDLPTTDQFSVSRYNLIYKIPSQYESEFTRQIGTKPIDRTFEVQLRSLLSEGWHEVEHDLRYKSKENWDGQEDLSRALNGIMATLETSEWSMRRIFNELAYRHYKSRSWTAMLHVRLRMRVAPVLSPELVELLNSNVACAKEVFRVDRMTVFEKLAQVKPKLPITLDNIVFLWNFYTIKHEALTALTPDLVTESLRSATPTAD